MSATHDSWRIRHFIRDARNLPGGDNTIVAQPVAGGTVTKSEMQEWGDHLQSSDSPIVQIYLQMICHHVNTQAGLQGPGVPLNAIPDVLLQPHEAYRWMMDEPGGHILAAIQLRDLGITRAVFQQIQYFFMPINYANHRAIVVISPIDRTVEILDSYSQHGRWENLVNNIYTKVFEFLEYFLGQNFPPAAQWRTLSTEAPRQIDHINCGVHVCQNAMAIACRQPLGRRTYLGHNAYRERARIGSEILHGSFAGLFNTHPVNAHPGPEDRLTTKAWQPVNPQLLTPQRRRRYLQNRNKQWHTNRCRALNAARGPLWMRGHTAWACSGQTRAQFLDAIEQRLDAIYQRTYVP